MLACNRDKEQASKHPSSQAAKLVKVLVLDLSVQDLCPGGAAPETLATVHTYLGTVRTVLGPSRTLIASNVAL